MPSRAAATSSPRLIQAVPDKPKRLPKPAPGVVEQVQIAFKPKNRIAMIFGCLLGGAVPVSSYVAAHLEIDFAARGWRDIGHTVLVIFLVAGGLLFSAKTVYQWGKMAFNDGAKALGFVVLMELVMVASHTQWLGLGALIYLIGINAISIGCALSLKPNRAP